jgi:hypothetical protein
MDSLCWPDLIHAPIKSWSKGTIEEKEHDNCLLFLLTIVKIRSRPFASSMFISLDLVLVGWYGILSQCSIRSIQ